MLTEFYVMISVRSFALEMIQIFLPVYVFSLRMSVFDLFIFLFFTFFSLSIFFPLAARVVSRIGNAHTMLLSTPFTILFFAVLYFFNPLSIGLPLIGLIYGFGEAFFWMAFHDEFSIISQSKKMGSEVGLYKSITIIAKILGPLFGGLLILFFGFGPLFLLIIVLMVLALIPLLSTQDIKSKKKFDPSKVYTKKNLALAKPIIGYGAASLATAWLWPLFVFLLLTGYLELGLLAVMVNIITIIGIFVIGFKADHINKRKLVKAGSILFSSTVILRVFSRTALHATAAWFFGALTWPLLDVPFEAITYEKSKHMDKLEFFVAREHFLFIGRMVVLGVLLAFISLPVMTALSIAIFAGGILTTLYWFV